MNELPAAIEQTVTRRRERWRKAQKVRRDRLSDGGKVLFRAWVSSDEAAWIKQAWRRNGGRWRFLLVLDLDGFAQVVREALDASGITATEPMRSEDGAGDGTLQQRRATR